MAVVRNRSGFAAALACVVFIAAVLIAAEAIPPEPASHPVPPEKAIDYIRLAPGLKMELVACEPQVIDPVALRFDEQGRLWVVEMRDYPHGPAKGEKAQSRIRILTDANDDGLYETATTFAD